MIVPENLKRDKGWVGQLLEWHLAPPQQAVNLNKISLS